MTITFKPGQHPDADQLSAFIEQALPAHEREGVLAHLAVCRECRGVVALALPEEPASQQVAPAHEPRRWFAGWMVLVPTVAAVAALAVFVFVHRQMPATQQQAQMTPEPPPAPQLQRQVARAATSPATAQIAGSEKPAAPKLSEGTPRAAMGAVGGYSAGAAGGASGTVSQGRQMDQPQLQVPSANTYNSFVPAEKARTAGGLPPTEQNSTQQNVIHDESEAATINANQLQPPRANNQELAQQQNNYQNRNSGSEKQTVTVQAPGPTLQVQDVAPRSSIPHREIERVAGGRAIGVAYPAQPLPSGRAVLSTAAEGPMVLAIDTHHELFVSNNSGQHWQPVRAAWKGHAVRVEAVALPQSFARDKTLSLPATGMNVDSLVVLQPGAVDAKTANATLTGTVTDGTGAVIPGATVTVTEPATGLSRSMTTDAGGRYTVAGLEPGNYNLDASERGFETRRLTNVAVSAANANVANVTLNVGAATETVTVEADANTIQTTDASISNAPLRKVKKAPKAAAHPAPVFEIVTDKGVRWASADGINWQRR